MASLRTSSARIQFRLLSSWARRTYASPQGGGFRDVPTTGMLQPRDAFSLRRLLTTPSSSAGLPLSPSPTNPPQGSSAGRGEGGGFLLRFKLLCSALGLVFTGLVGNEVYCVYLACRGDAPIQVHGTAQPWISSTNMDAKALLDKDPSGRFYMVVGCPGIGKTTQFCDAARDRGAAIYLDGAAQQSFKNIQATIDERYRSLRLSFMSWIRSNRESRLQTLSKLSFWVKLFRRKHLVLIVDHIDKLAEADVLQLVSWAKMEADHNQVVVILVGSEQSTSLISNSDTRTRGKLVICYPPSAQETREALKKFNSTRPDKYNLDVEKCLYLRGTCPTEYLYDDLYATEEYLMEQLTEKHDRFEWQRRDFRDVDFWFTLLVAGSNGVSVVEDQKRGYYVPDIAKLLSEPCILYYHKKVYFISGRSREMHATCMLSVYQKEVDESSAEVERLSALSDKSQELANEKEKLATAKERIAKIQECMSNKSYEAYGPL